MAGRGSLTNCDMKQSSLHHSDDGGGGFIDRSGQMDVDTKRRSRCSSSIIVSCRIMVDPPRSVAWEPYNMACH